MDDPPGNRCHRVPRPDADPADDSPDRIAGGAGRDEGLEHQHHRPLGRQAAGVRGIERGPRCGRERPFQRHPLEGHQVHRPLSRGTEHRVAIPLPEHVDGGGDRRQGRAVAGVERQRPAHQVERLGESAGERAAGETAGLIDQRRHLLEHLLVEGGADGVDLPGLEPPPAEGGAQVDRGLGQAQPHLQVVGKLTPEHRPDHDAGSGPVEPCRPTEVGDRGVGSLEEHELQRIGRGDLLGGYLVPTPVVVEPDNEATQPRHRPPRARRGAVEGPAQAPALRRHLDEHRCAAVEHIAERRRRQAPGEHAADTDDGDGGVVGRRGASRRYDGGIGRLRQRQVDVEPADAEGVDRGKPRTAVGPVRPRQRRARHDERPVVPGKLLVELVAGGTRWDDAVLHRQDDLDEARQPRRLQRVADVGLHTADGDASAGGKVPAEESGQCPQFGGIAHLRAGRMGLDVVDAGDVGGIGVGPLHGEHLPFAPRGPQALPFPVAGHADRADHGADPVAVGAGPRERLDDEGHVALGSHEPVGVTAERTRAGVAHRLCRREQHEAVGLAVRRPPDDRLIDATFRQRPGGDRQGLEGRRARRVDHEIRAVEAQRFLDDAGGAEGVEIESLSRTPARISITDRCGDFGGDRGDLRAEEPTGHLDVLQQGRVLVDARRVHEVTDPGAAAGVADVHAGAPPTGHGERIEAGVAAGLRGHLEEHEVGDVVSLPHLRRQRTGERVGVAVGNDGPHLRIGATEPAFVRVEVKIAGQT